MALRRSDLEALPGIKTYERPDLRLVTAPPLKTRPGAAVVFVLLIAGLLGLPAARAALKEAPVPQAWSYRGVPASQIDALDRGAALPGGRIPRSAEPAGGIAFVRCTRLWSARPDGSDARRILSLTGVSSPTFSPDGRTLAFFAPDASFGKPAGLAIWMAGADGSNARPVAPLRADGSPIAARPLNLTWAPSGGRLAFALIDPAHDPWSGGSSIWTYDIGSGTFEKDADGWPVPFWTGKRVAYSKWSATRGETFWSSGSHGGSRRESRLSSQDADLTAAVSPGRWTESWESGHGTVALRRVEGRGAEGRGVGGRGVEGQIVVAAKRTEWHRGTKAVHAAPSPYRIVSSARVALTQDTDRALVTLADPRGDRALGLLDLSSGDWTVVRYAWDGAATPAPTASGPLGARRAASFVGDLMNNWRDDEVTALLVADHDEELLPFRPRGHFLGEVTRTEEGWSVPVTALGRISRTRWMTRQLAIEISSTKDDRVEARSRATAPVSAIETIEDARVFLADMLGERFRWPTFIPKGAKLDARWPLDVYSYGDYTQTTVRFDVPGDGPQTQEFSISYGDVDFGLGCGGENRPEDGTVGEEPAIYDSISYQDGETTYRTDQVLWPATLDDRSAAFYTVYGTLGKDTVTAIAASMR